MNTLTRTLSGTRLEILRSLSVPFLALEGTTLNEKLDIQADAVVAATEFPTLAYIGIGNGGYKITRDKTNSPRFETIPHQFSQTALYSQLPFVLRPLDNDLSAKERAEYRLRRIEHHNGISYVAYYLKRLHASDDFILCWSNAQFDSDFWLTGITPYLDKDTPVSKTDKPSSFEVVFTFTDTDANEFMNVINVLHGDTNYAVISEIALCSGVDRNVNNTSNATVNEAIAVQITNFVSVFHSVVACGSITLSFIVPNDVCC